jgi:hypothetical protein
MRRFVSSFLVPLVRGGAVRIGRPLGSQAVERLAREAAAAEPEAAGRLGASRLVVASRLLPTAAAPPLDETSLRLAAALHDLLALSHPGLAGPGLAKRQQRIAYAAFALASVGPPASAREAVNRHSLLARLPEIARVDSTVSFWLGRHLYLGRTPPRRVTAMPGLRRVRIERRDRSWLREIGIPAVARRAFLALSAASPIGEALDPLRLEPPLGWGRILPILRFPPLARIVAGRALELGVDRAGDVLGEALYRFASYHDPPVGLPASGDAVGFGLRFLAHIVWLDVLYGGGEARTTPEGERAGFAAPVAAPLAALLAAPAAGRQEGPGIDLAVILTAAARTRLSLVWPPDVPRTGDLAEAFRARLASLAARAEDHGLPRFPAALGLAELAVAPATAA